MRVMGFIHSCTEALIMEPGSQDPSSFLAQTSTWEKEGGSVHNSRSKLGHGWKCILKRVDSYAFIPSVRWNVQLSRAIIYECSQVASMCLRHQSFQGLAGLLNKDYLFQDLTALACSSDGCLGSRLSGHLPC